MKKTALIKLGNRLKALRKHCDLTQAKLAELADIADTYYSGVECGKRNISFKNIDALARAYKLSWSELLNEKHFPKIKKTKGKKLSQKK